MLRSELRSFAGEQFEYRVWHQFPALVCILLHSDHGLNVADQLHIRRHFAPTVVIAFQTRHDDLLNTGSRLRGDLKSFIPAVHCEGHRLHGWKLTRNTCINNARRIVLSSVKPDSFRPPRTVYMLDQDRLQSFRSGVNGRKVFLERKVRKGVLVFFRLDHQTAVVTDAGKEIRRLDVGVHQRQHRRNLRFRDRYPDDANILFHHVPGEWLKDALLLCVCKVEP